MSRTLRSLTSPELLNLSTRLALLVHLNIPLHECAARLNLTLAATKRLLKKPETQSALSTLAARSLAALSRAETDALTRAQTTLIANLDDAVAELVKVALTDNMAPYPTKLSAIIEILDRSGLTTRLAAHSSNTETPEHHTTPEMTSDLLDSLTGLVKAISSTTPPPAEPPQLPESYRLLRHGIPEDIEVQAEPAE